MQLADYYVRLPDLLMIRVLLLSSACFPTFLLFPGFYNKLSKIFILKNWIFECIVLERINLVSVVFIFAVPLDRWPSPLITSYLYNTHIELKQHYTITIIILYSFSNFHTLHVTCKTFTRPMKNIAALLFSYVCIALKVVFKLIFSMPIPCV